MNMIRTAFNVLNETVDARENLKLYEKDICHNLIKIEFCEFLEESIFVWDTEKDQLFVLEMLDVDDWNYECDWDDPITFERFLSETTEMTIALFSPDVYFSQVHQLVQNDENRTFAEIFLYKSILSCQLITVMDHIYNQNTILKGYFSRSNIQDNRVINWTEACMFRTWWDVIINGNGPLRIRTTKDGKTELVDLFFWCLLPYSKKDGWLVANVNLIRADLRLL